MKKRIALPYFFCLAGIILLTSCSDASNDTIPTPGGGTPGTNDWLIPQDQVFDGGPGKDGIPSIDNPKFSNASEIDFLSDEDLVIGVKVGEDIRAYPHPILDWHEIVNDKIGGLPLAVTYCPLTGTAIGWKREVKGQETTFGVSGLLYNTNLIPYDRNTDSRWSQMLLKSVNGNLSGTEIETYPLIETTWKTWKQLFPNSKVLNTNTGFSRSYGVYPYGNYRTNNNFLIFPVTPEDKRLPQKDRGLGIIVENKAKFYPLNKFNSGSVSVEEDQFQGLDLVVVGSAEQNFIMAFDRRLPDGKILQFQAINQTGQAVVMKDDEGNEWNVFGEAVAGLRKGTQLKAVEGYIGYWFAWGAFYPNLEIF